MLPPRSPTHGNTCLGMLLRTMRMCSRQTEAPTILMHWRHFLRNAAEIPSKPNSNSQNGTHHGLALTTMRHTLGHPTYRETKDVSRNRHIAPQSRACYDLQRNQTVVLRNSSRLHTEKHDGKPHRGTKTMSAQVGESHGSTMNRLSKSPTANHKREARLVTAAFAEKLPCGPTRPPHTSQKNMFPRAANFNCHDMLRTSLSSDTQPPLVRNSPDHACPMPTAPPLARQRGNTLSAANEFASDGESNVESQSPQSQLS